MKQRTPDWLVERLHAGDLPPEEAQRVRARLTEDGEAGRLDALRQDDAAFRIAHPVAPALEEIRRRAGAPAPRAPRRWVVLPALAAVAAAALVLLVPHRQVNDLSGLDPDGTRPKGLQAHLQVHRQRAGAGPEALASGAAARAGDLLQLSYVSAGAPWGVIVSVDGRGAVTLHWPEGGGQAAALQGGGAVPLAHAYQLDDAPRFERFFLVTGPKRFPAAVVLEAAKRLAASGDAEAGALALPAGLAQQAVTLKKVP